MKPIKTDTTGRVSFLREHMNQALSSEPFNLTWTNSTGSPLKYVLFDISGICGNLGGWIIDGVIQPGYERLIPLAQTNGYVMNMTAYAPIRIEAISIQTGDIAQAIQNATFYRAEIDGNIKQSSLDTAAIIRNDQFQPNVMDIWFPYTLDLLTAMVINVLPGETISIVFFPPNTYSSYLKGNNKWQQWIKPMLTK